MNLKTTRPTKRWKTAYKFVKNLLFCFWEEAWELVHVEVLTKAVGVCACRSLDKDFYIERLDRLATFEELDIQRQKTGHGESCTSVMDE